MRVWRFHHHHLFIRNRYSHSDDVLFPFFVVVFFFLLLLLLANREFQRFAWIGHNSSIFYCKYRPRSKINLWNKSIILMAEVINRRVYFRASFAWKFLRNFIRSIGAKLINLLYSFDSSRRGIASEISKKRWLAI